MPDVTQLLNAIDAGDPWAADELLPLVYEELRKLAIVRMANEKAGQTLQPTALVHEAWLKIAGDGDPHFANRRHFFKAAAAAMQQILTDIARRKQRLKHGSGQTGEELHDLVETRDTGLHFRPFGTGINDYSNFVACSPHENRLEGRSGLLISAETT